MADGGYDYLVLGSIAGVPIGAVCGYDTFLSTIAQVTELDFTPGTTISYSNTGYVLAAIAAERPDLVKLGQYAGAYGFVMHGGTAAKALQVYELQAKEFTAYWSGDKSLDDALAAAKAGMANLLKPCSIRTAAALPGLRWSSPGGCGRLDE